MRCVQIGPNIQVKEEILPEFPFWGYFEDKENEIPCGCDLSSNDKDEEFPLRCSRHNTEYCRWKRKRDGVKKLKKMFNKKRHRCIKMLTFGLPSIKGTNQENKIDDHKFWREELRKKFHTMRRDRNGIWKSYVDGGMWFFETVLKGQGESESYSSIHTDEQEDWNDDKLSIHPHFHCIVLGPKNLAGKNRDFEELNALFEKHGLGKPSVTLPRDKKGKPLASINKASWYVTKYLDKPNQVDGSNRGSFGNFNIKEKKT